MVLQAVSTGREQLVFSPRDRSRIGKQVVVAANEALVKEVAPELPDSLADSRVGALLGKVVNSAAAQITGTGLLSLSEETRPIRGGFILVDGPVEVNCSFETLFRLQREKLEKQVPGGGTAGQGGQQRRGPDHRYRPSLPVGGDPSHPGRLHPGRRPGGGQLFL